MKFPGFGRKKQQPLTVADHKRPLSPNIDRRFYYRPIQINPKTNNARNAREDNHAYQYQ
jgi:hypothetical protein